jgi:hypothetical protein
MKGLDAALRRRPLRQQALEHLPPNANDAAIFADFDTELDGIHRVVPSRIIGKREQIHRLHIPAR